MDGRRSLVRQVVTYSAALFVFVGGGIMIITLAVYSGEDGIDAAKDLFTAILPIATGVITYWFAGRAMVESGVRMS